MHNNPLDWKIDLSEKPPSEQVLKQKEAKYQADLLYHQVFATPKGKQLLKLLRENTIEAGTWLSSLPYDKAIAHGFAREGQNALVRNMEQAVNRIEQAKDFENYCKLF